MREFIVEADGGSRGNPGPAGYGAVVLDAATGETLVEAAEYIGIATNNVAEYRGLLSGLLAARQLDPAATVHVRMDSKLVIEQMSGRWKIKHPDMKPLATEASRVLPPAQVTYEWIPREQNKHADRLANEAMDAGRRGEQWSASTSTAELDAAAAKSTARAAAAAPPDPAGPPGDAAAGAALAGASSVAPSSRRGRAERPVGADAEAGPDAAAARSAAGGSARSELSGPPGDAAAGAARVGAALAGASSVAPASRRGRAERPVGADAEAGPDAAAARSAAGGSARSELSGLPGDAAAGAAPVGGAGTAEGSSEAERSSKAAEPSAGGGAKAEADVRAARTVAAPSAGWAPADLGAPATLVLLRHGETPLTPQKRFSGSGGTDPSLSDVGREQAERVAAALARRGTIQAVVASPLARTRETAAAVAARLGLDVSIDDGLRETDFGAWEGLTFGEVRQRYPDDLNAWLADPEAEPTGGGESFAATATRIAATRDKLVSAYAGRTVLLVSHVTPIKTFLRLALGAPPESLFRMELSAASLSAVAYYADGNASVRLFNDTSHLRP
ncbi:bifunctional RNase H/acid phosphatase [Streptomyces sp. HUCO-GS316]|uniref:bifunctional RNase H/acid phosphatase n=1 Tax=Streptomyces sp. HUCO-GS316 TaxID=2692198 RepID=UPI00136B13A9|nr:bifunctional RNase H/acid phosphatase [Streptomyces sp. HUCO-GS316]